MTLDNHEKARELISLGEPSVQEREVSGDRLWLRAHLQTCAACSDYAEAAGRVVSALRSQPFAADSGLVQATHLRLRHEAGELRLRQQRLSMVGLACLLVGLSTVLTTPLSWQAFEWIGVHAGVSKWLWHAAFIYFWIAPGLLISALLLARGTYLDPGSRIDQ